MDIAAEMEAGHLAAARAGQAPGLDEEVEAGRSAVERAQERLEEEIAAGRRAAGRSTG